MPNETEVDPVLFDRMLQDFEDQYAAEGVRGWKPDPGSYVCSYVETRRRIYKDKESGRSLVAWVPVLEIVDGPLAGKRFEAGFFSPRNFMSFGIFVSAVAGRPVTTLAEADRVLREAESERRLLTVRIEAREQYKNVRIEGIVKV